MKFVFGKLKQFQYIYILYFPVDILHSLALLLNIFQNKFVDVTTIGSIIRIQIAQIRMLFIVEQTDLNASTFNENIGYHVIPEYGLLGGHLRKLSREIHEKIFYGFEMDRSRLEDDLEDAFKFQRTFAKAVCAGLDARFVDNDLISCFKILNLPICLQNR